MTDLFIPILLSGLLAWALTGVMVRYAQKLGFVDIPNERSSHSRIVPRSGGLSIVITFLGVLIFYYLTERLDSARTLALVPGGVAVALIGLLDDHRGVASRVRFAVHLGSAGFAIYWLEGMPALNLVFMTIDFGLLGYLIGIFFIAWLLNLYNFMDGIDGIAGLETLTVCWGAAFIGFVHADATPFYSEILLLLGMSSLGFCYGTGLRQNIHGRCGQWFLGYIIAVLVLICAHEQHVSLWAWLILLGCFIVDSTFTLFRRMSRGEKWYSAHRSHTYQRASRRFQSHGRITVTVGAINVLWLLPLAFLANPRPSWGLLLLLVAWAPLVGLAKFSKLECLMSTISTCWGVLGRQQLQQCADIR